MSKKVLIMSASTGGGHNRAARAIEEELIKKTVNGESIECKIVDSLKLVNTTMDKIISRGYEKSAIYTPNAYGRVYRLSESGLVSKNEFKDNMITTFMAKKFRKLLLDEKPDVIIGTHPFPMIALSTLKKQCSHHAISNTVFHSSLNDKFVSYFNINQFPILISVLTDYTTHSTWIQNELDYYIVGHEYVKELLISEGVDSNKIKPLGIPVEKSFLQHRNRELVLSELGFDSSKLTVLLMGGSFGAGNIKETLEELININRDFQILVITGKNESLKEKLDKKLKLHNLDKKVKVLGFTNKMNDILASIDVLVTKPGGLTTTEALLKDVPMIVPYYIPGQEEENLDFLCNCGSALRTTKKYSLSVLLKVLIDDSSRLEILKKNIKSIRKFNSSQNIANLVVENLSIIE
ncbi:glycosyl transferase family protein [[Clostridium] sordellii]|uniref:Glycosyl transferase n=1 Tax=Paraclostridium sordellii TaxID=1505 RepID=A0ABM9RTG4_PARSO|nr:glycosyltransferase [Paeniclostridium sordellii]CEJ75383.1 putative glycosyl transferase [[Clostridium] sordellii] [Paeniclostridium sordellii]CEN70146.1 glycosyl transferase family protein [[Clostridium] sordellii] [Paeniclostridium sordellii]CEN73149.1 glycosyl transferase family protein [[Clostridium] sordellii] [Paeniclostridium sordellii]CEO26963.1 glycosyl transferase family protein [[Clostridium] sordellii] [Paeniclostridium sordellii]CEP65214.1 glycosyl transferase family protein [[